MNETIETTTVPVEIKRARCEGYSGYTERDGTVVPGFRKHLVAIDRLIDPMYETRFTGRGGRIEYITAKGKCPVCGIGWAPYGLFGHYGPAGTTVNFTVQVVRGTTTDNRCKAACLQSVSAECKCSCGGGNHGLYA